MDLLRDGHLFGYLAGVAGTGKSWTATKWCEERPLARVLTATTGIAAVNLGGARTINSLLWGYKDTRTLKDYWTTGKLSQCIASLSVNGIREILVDEVSMMGAKQLDVLIMAIDEHNARVAEGVLPDCSYLGMILVGDFCQLPPVDEAYAFEAECWDRFDANTQMLTEIKRQTDREFIEALHHVRSGIPERVKLGAEHFEPMMNDRCDAEYDGATLFGRNDQVNRYNELGLRRCKGEKYSILNEVRGEPEAAWKHIPKHLILKDGSLVMILSNSGPDLEYCNGDLGHVVGFNSDKDDTYVKVRMMRNGNEVEIRMITREHKKIVDKKLTKVGEIIYMPLRLAYSSTVHKMQGLTVDRAQLDFRDHFFARTPGMLYVALSRARNSKGLRLVGKVDTFVKRAKTDPRLARWI